DTPALDRPGRCRSKRQIVGTLSGKPLVKPALLSDRVKTVLVPRRRENGLRALCLEAQLTVLKGRGRSSEGDTGRDAVEDAAASALRPPAPKFQRGGKVARGQLLQLPCGRLSLDVEADDAGDRTKRKTEVARGQLPHHSRISSSVGRRS